SGLMSIITGSKTGPVRAIRKIGTRSFQGQWASRLLPTKFGSSESSLLPSPKSVIAPPITLGTARPPLRLRHYRSWVGKISPVASTGLRTKLQSGYQMLTKLELLAEKWTSVEALPIPTDGG